MRTGVAFALRHPHEAVHVQPLQERLADVAAASPQAARVVVQADTRPPVKGAWNVQVFHGLGDKGYVGNPIFLQRGRWPRARTAANRIVRALRLPAPFLRPPRRPGRRPSRYDQLNAYGPRFRDHFQEQLTDAQITMYGHVRLNELEGWRPDPEGHLVWLPTWDNRAYLGGPNQSSLDAFAHEVALVSRQVPVRVKYHPLTVAHHQSRRARAELQEAPGVEVVDAQTDAYELLHGARGVVTDTSSIGFEAYCLGCPVAVAQPPGVRHEGLHRELAARTDVLRSGRPDLLEWAEAPSSHRDATWCDDLLVPPRTSRNGDFARNLRQRLSVD